MKKTSKLMSSILVCAMLASGLVLPANASEDNMDYYNAVASLASENQGNNFIGSISLTVGEPTMIIDGREEEIDFGRDTAPIIKNDRTLLPVRAVVEALGGDISYDSSDRSVTIDTDETTIEMTIDDTEMYVNGKRQTTDVAPIIENDRTFLPIRAVTENLNCDVEWDQDTETVSIYNTYQTKRIVVQTDSDIDFDEYDPDTIIGSSDGEYVLQFSTIEEAKACCEELQERSDVEYAEADGYIPPDNSEDGYEEMSSGGFKSWGVKKIGADVFAEALSNSRKNTSAVVAVVDSGVDSNHSFLKGRIASGGIDFANGDSNPYDDNSHGTHVSGTIVDCTPDLNVKILPIKVMDASGSGFDTTISVGIRYAADKGADVINLSLGGSVSSIIDSAMSYAIRKGTSVVAAAGNDARDTKYYSPARYKDAIIVSATDSDDDRAYFSNYGDSVDIAAPGVNIISSIPGGGFSSKSGTSMATPHAAAIAAMFKIYDNSMSPSEIERSVRKYVDDLGAKGWDKYYGTGRISVENVMDAAPTKAPIKEPTPTPKGSDNEIVSYTWSVGNISLQTGESKNIKLYANYRDGSKKDVTSSCGLYSEDKSIATVTSSGNVTGKSAGSTTVYFDKAVASSVSVPRPLNVTVKAASTPTPKPTPTPTPKPTPTAKPTPVPEKDTIISYSWSENEITVGVGETKSIKLYANFKSGAKKDVTSEAELYSEDINVATVTSNGKVTGKGSGITNIYFDKAVSSGVTMPRPLKVVVPGSEDSDMVSLEWSVGSVQLGVGETTSIKLYAVYDDGSKKDITKECQLYSMDNSIAKVTSDGKITGIGKGSTEIWMDSIPEAGVDLPRFLKVTVK